MFVCYREVPPVSMYSWYADKKEPTGAVVETKKRRKMFLFARLRRLGPDYFY